MAGAISITDTSEDASDLTTYSFASQSFGAEASDRYMLVGVGWREASANDRTLSSASIGGIAADILSQAHIGAGGIAIIGAEVPTGETGTVSITFNTTNSRCMIAVGRATGIDFSSAFDTAEESVSLSGEETSTLTADLNVAEDGVAFGYQFATEVTITPTLAWSGTDGLTAATQQVGESSVFYARAGTALTPSDQTPRDINAAVTVGSDIFSHAFAVVSFSPAEAGNSALPAMMQHYHGGSA
jgi:hypothetical protein